MNPAEEIEGTAAEFALGTLAPDERAAAAVRRPPEPLLDTAIIRWERMLGPLAEAIPSVAPPPTAYAGIEQRLFTRAGRDERRLRRKVVVESHAALKATIRKWQTIAAGFAGLLALSLLGLGLREWQRRTAPPAFTAFLQASSAAQPAFLATWSPDRRILTVRSLAPAAPAGQSYELWLVDASVGGPRSLGVVGARTWTTAPTTAFADGTVRAASYEITLEPAGGSGTGSPTGRAIYSGKLVQILP